MEPAKSVEERLIALEIFKEEVSKTTKVRFVGADKLSKRGLELHTSSREFWRLKIEVCDLLLESLDPLLPSLFPEESKRTAVRNEFKECLSHVEYINGISPAGGDWGKERAIDLLLGAAMVVPTSGASERASERILHGSPRVAFLSNDLTRQ